MLFVPAQPALVREPQVVILNHRLANELGLNLGVLSSEAAANLFAGRVLPEGSHPIAQAYAGHQYGHFTMLGDGIFASAAFLPFDDEARADAHRQRVRF